MSGPVTLRQLSARSFWGNSKVLDDRLDLVTGLFPDLEILGRSVPVNVFLPETYAGVLFIENQDTYAQLPPDNQSTAVLSRWCTCRDFVAALPECVLVKARCCTTPGRAPKV